MPELILRSGKRAGRRIALPVGDVVIGRDDGCRIRLTSSDVSRQHCRLRCREDEVIVADLGSRNGTFINETRVASPTALKPGDLLRVGPFLFQTPGADGQRDLESDITGWLTVEGAVASHPPESVKNETTLMPKIDEEESPGREEELSADAPTRLAAETQREDCVNKNDPVIQQAAEIIRDFWAAKALKKSVVR